VTDKQSSFTPVNMRKLLTGSSDGRGINNCHHFFKMTSD
ncbi:MAG: hypothetical protein ACI9FJ_002311, partial [Alteromonadaceae bacterium]